MATRFKGGIPFRKPRPTGAGLSDQDGSCSRSVPPVAPKKSRSQVYAEALAEYVARHDEDQPGLRPPPA